VEQKKGRMSRVYDAPGKKASPEKVKKGGKDMEKGMMKKAPVKRMGK
jgi:hypothetical protein